MHKVLLATFFAIFVIVVLSFAFQAFVSMGDALEMVDYIDKFRCDYRPMRCVA